MWRHVGAGCSDPCLFVFSSLSLFFLPFLSFLFSLFRARLAVGVEMGGRCDVWGGWSTWVMERWVGPWVD